MWEEKDIERVLVSKEEIVSRCEELGAQITKDYAGKDSLFLIALLKGSVPFLAELMKHIDLDIQIDFMDVSSYAGAHSTGEIKILKDLETPVFGKDVLIIEDIVDTGKTLKTVKRNLGDRGANTVKVATLLNKPEGRVVAIEPDYSGFTVPNAFVVGFGLDYDQRYRCLPYVGVLKRECYEGK